MTQHQPLPSSIDNLIYLFELDSVRKSERECIEAQKALFKEIMSGNIVVLSYNQISSLAMFDLLDIYQNQHTRKPVLKLLDEGRIQVSQYGTDTVIDYITKSLKPDGPFFIFSNLYFLNRLGKDDPVYRMMDSVLHNTMTLPSIRDLEQDYFLETRYARKLHEYMDIMTDVVKRIKPVKRTEDTPTSNDLYYYIQTAINASKKYCNIPENSEIDSAPFYEIVEKGTALLEMSMTTSPQKTRSSLQKELQTPGNNDTKAICFARAVLDISYNYQVQYSISGVTITHDLADQWQLANTVYTYYKEHDFSAADQQYIPLKHTRILYWNALAKFCGSSRDDITDRDTWKKHLRSVIAHNFLCSLGIVLLIIAIWKMTEFFEYISPTLQTFGMIGFTLLILTNIALEIINALFPTSIFDGWMSFINSFRYLHTYLKFRKGECKYVYLFEMDTLTSIIKKIRSPRR